MGPYHMGPYDTISYGTISYETISYGTISYGAISYGTISYGTIPYGTISYGNISYGTLWYGSFKKVHIIWTSLDHMVPTICYGKCLSFIFMDPNFEFFFLNFLWSILNQHNCQPNNFFAYFYISFTW